MSELMSIDSGSSRGSLSRGGDLRRFIYQKRRSGDDNTLGKG